MDKREAAIALAEKGFRVFPIPAGSKAANTNFIDTGSSDVEITSERWNREHNIAIETGRDIFVLDFDGEKGLADLERFEALCIDTSAKARTAGGGIHVFLRLRPGRTVRQRIKTLKSGDYLYAGTDVKGWHGYVVAPGSETSKGAYCWLDEPRSLADVPMAPDWLLDAIGKPKERSKEADEPPPYGWDRPIDLKRSQEYLLTASPPAEQGQRGIVAYTVACRLRDFGVSENEALAMMAEFWNVEGKVDPPAPYEDLCEAIEHAYVYAQNQAGCMQGAEFDFVEDLIDPFAPRKRRRLKAIDLPKREWIVEGVAARGYLTGLVAPSGAGKTQFLTQIMLAVSGVQPMQGLHCNSGRVWMWNQEDDLDELERRILAAEKRFGVNADERDMHVNSGASKPLVLVKRDPESGFLRTTLAVRNIIASIKEFGIDLLIIDPLAEFHEANENDNVEMRYVAAVLRRIAVEGNCAVIVGHHTRKPDSASSDGFAGNADSARGASALQGVTRVMLTLYSMSSKDAKAYGVSEDDRSSFVRLDGAKSNISAAGRGLKPIWYRWQGEAIGNGDVVGVLEHASLVRSRTKVERAEETSVVIDILAGRDDGWHKWQDIADEVTALTGWSERTARRHCQTLTSVETRSLKGKAGMAIRLIGHRTLSDKTMLSENEVVDSEDENDVPTIGQEESCPMSDKT